MARLRRAHARYGNNAIAVPMLLELIDFDRVTDPADPRGVVYDADSAFRARHAAVRAPSGRSSSGRAGAACRCFSRPTCWP